MIIAILFCMIIIFCISTVMMFSKKYFIIFSLVSFLMVCGSLWLIFQNDNHQLGMYVVSDETTLSLDSTYKSSIPLLVYKQLGNANKNSERIYQYRPSIYNSTYLTKKDNVAFRVIQNNHQTSNNANLMTIRKDYKFKNMFWRVLFWGSSTKRLKSTTYIFEVPNNWLILESKQAEKLPKMASQLTQKNRIKASTMISSIIKQKVTEQVNKQAPAIIEANMKKQIALNPSLLTNKQQYANTQRSISNQVVTDLTKQTTKNIEQNDLPAIKKQVSDELKNQMTKTLKDKLE